MLPFRWTNGQAGGRAGVRADEEVDGRTNGPCGAGRFGTGAFEPGRTDQKGGTYRTN